LLQNRWIPGIDIGSKLFQSQIELKPADSAGGIENQTSIIQKKLGLTIFSSLERDDAWNSVAIDSNYQKIQRPGLTGTEAIGIEKAATDETAIFLEGFLVLDPTKCFLGASSKLDQSMKAVFAAIFKHGDPWATPWPVRELRRE
jgi:hypothetical protein